MCTVVYTDAKKKLLGFTTFWTQIVDVNMQIQYQNLGYFLG